ncbi:MAG TPA: uroporphyrinogen-III synthase [Thermoanaerobaculia bacterium]|nr:uroporphyrinogen-III synthase [Thermoanaerobaculia bacterium]
MKAPLAGVRVVVTRAEHQAESFAAAFEAAGATIEILPLLEIVPPADPRPLERAATELALYDWLVFTSANAVDAFLPLTGGALPERLKIAVVGPATAEALRAYEIEPHLEARRSDAEGLAADLAPHVGRRRRRVLLPQAADARPALVEGLSRAGAEAVTVVAYDKRLPPDAPRRAAELFSPPPIGWVTFTSPRIVRHFAGLFGADWERRRGELLAASIGPVTSAELRNQGVEPAVEATRPGYEGLVAAVIDRVRPGSPPEPGRSTASA